MLDRDFLNKTSMRLDIDLSGKFIEGWAIGAGIDRAKGFRLPTMQTKNIWIDIVQGDFGGPTSFGSIIKKDPVAPEGDYDVKIYSKEYYLALVGNDYNDLPEMPWDVFCSGILSIKRRSNCNQLDMAPFSG